MAATDPMVKRFMRRKKKPPRDVVGAPTHLIPGYGDYQVTRGAINAASRNPNDGAQRPRYGAQRAPYRKGERFKRKYPYKYSRGDAGRPHRPRLD